MVDIDFYFFFCLSELPISYLPRCWAGWVGELYKESWHSIIMVISALKDVTLCACQTTVMKSGCVSEAALVSSRRDCVLEAVWRRLCGGGCVEEAVCVRLCG